MAGEREPYVGPRPFAREDAPLFFGREREADQLLSLVIAHPVVLLYAQSGAGKTSLINARLLPLLEKRRAEVFGPARVGGELPHGLAPSDVTNVYVFNALASLDDRADDKGPRGADELKRLGRSTFAEFLGARPHVERAEGVYATRVVVFDQFEEVFTTHLERWRDREEFFQQIGDALEQDKRLRVLFSMREEYLASTDPHAAALPERLRTRLRLERLRERAALEAVERPLEGTGRTFAPGVAARLVKSLLEVKVKTPERTLDVAGEYVEPVQLQVVCRSLWESVPPEVKVIDETHVETYGDVDHALIKYYEDSLKSASALRFARRGLRLTNAPLRFFKEALLRQWFETELITPGGTRGLVYKDTEATGSLPNHVAEHLESLHLVRAESRGGALWYELSHDRFVSPILQSNRNWRVQRNTRLVLVLAVLVLLLSPFLLYTFYARRSAEARLEEEVLSYKGDVAANLSREPGKEFDALAWGLDATRVQKLDEPPPPAVEGLRAAAMKVGDALWLRRDSRAHGVELSADGKRALTHNDDEVCVWDAATGVLLFNAGSPEGATWDGAFFITPDGGRFAARSRRRQEDTPGGRNPPRGVPKEPPAFHFYDVASASSLDALRKQLEGFIWFNFSSNGTRILVVTEASGVRVFDADGRPVSTFGGRYNVETVRVSPTGRRALTMDIDSRVRLWETDTGRLISDVGNDIAGYNVPYSADGGRFAIVSDAGGITIFDASTGTRLKNLESKPEGYSTVAFSPDGQRIIQVSLRELRYVIHVWDLNTGQFLAEVPFNSPDWKLLGLLEDYATPIQAQVVDGKSRLSVFDLSLLAWRDLLKDVAGKISGAEVTQDLGRVACSFEDGPARVWEVGAPPTDFASMPVAELRARACKQIRYQPEYERVKEMCEPLSKGAP